MNYWKVIVATVVIFGAGVFTGGLLVNYVRDTHGRNNPPHHPVAVSGTNSVTPPIGAAPRLPEVLSRPFLPKLDNLLLLSSDQHKAIEKIITDAQAQMRKVSQDARVAIRSELTPDQRSRFDELMKRPRRAIANTNVVDLLSTNPPVSIPTNPPATTN